MPQRTNEFQHMVFLLQKALAGTNASITVCESAMVHNVISGNAEEIDVLVTFQLAGRTFRTGICCRDHARRSSPDWIRNLSKQREHLGLDAIVAVTSAGISTPAERTAKYEDVHVVHYETIAEVDWRSQLLPDSFCLIACASANLKVARVFCPTGYERRGPVAITSLVTADGRVWEEAALIKELHEAARRHALEQYGPETDMAWKTGANSRRTTLVRVQIGFAEGTFMAGSPRTYLAFLVVYFEVEVELIVSERRAQRRYSETESVLEVAKTQKTKFQVVRTDGPSGQGCAVSIENATINDCAWGDEARPETLVCGIRPKMSVYDHIPPIELDDVLLFGD